MDSSLLQSGIELRRLVPEAELPTRAHPGDAGLDLRAAGPAVIRPGGREAVATGWAVASIPSGCAALLMARSGLAARHGIGLANGVGLIDAGYRGELIVVLQNLGSEPFTVNVGDRIAQLVLTPVGLGPALEVAVSADSDGRGAGGFGSTGRQ